MAELDRLLFGHVASLKQEAIALPEGGALFSRAGFERHLLEGGSAPRPEPLSAACPEWTALRAEWAKVLPLESVTFEGWLSALQSYANLDWAKLHPTDLDL